MRKLTHRSYEKELLDNDQLPFSDIRQNMQELNLINTYLGGHNITIIGLKKLLHQLKHLPFITICEIGCGGGDNLKAIEKWCTYHKIDARFIGIDIKKACIDFAQEQYPGLNARWLIADYKTVEFNDQKPNIIFSSLFCHHFENDAILHMLRWMNANASTGFFINDLHRHPLAYYSIQFITRLFSGSYLVKNDAPLSVARGFKKKEWQAMISEAGIPNCTIQWKWAFRHLIVCKPTIVNP